MSPSAIELRGVRVHNLRGIDLDIPYRQLTVICGVSGSGKTSLALDTLYAEGQRRYIESFSAYTRQFLDRLERPDADRIDGIPPAIAVRHEDFSRAVRATIGTTSEIIEYLRLLFARVGRLFCRQCSQEIVRHTAHSAADDILQFPQGGRLLLGYILPIASEDSVDRVLAGLPEQGFVRAAWNGRIYNLPGDSVSLAALLRDFKPPDSRLPGETSADSQVARQKTELFVIVDRLRVGEAVRDRLVDSLEVCFLNGQGRCRLLCDHAPNQGGMVVDFPIPIDNESWSGVSFNNHNQCSRCNIEYAVPVPQLFSFASPLGACTSCEGAGDVLDWDIDLVIPDRGKALQESAIVPWQSGYDRQKKEVCRFAESCGISLEVPIHKLSAEQIGKVWNGAGPNGFAGIRGQLEELAASGNNPKMRTFLNRWRSRRPCYDCHGTRLNPEARAYRVEGKGIAELARMRMDELQLFFRGILAGAAANKVVRVVLEQISSRLSYLSQIGLGYLWLDRPLVTLSAGEAHRVALASALGSDLVNMLYVLDEPSAGLHPHDVNRLIPSIQRIRDRGNTVVVVEHDESLIRGSDHLVEIGPGAGERGGRLTFEGTVPELLQTKASVTADFLCCRRGAGLPSQRRATRHGWIRLAGARGNNLQNISAEFPLGVLCVVTGVSGAGKTTLVQDTLYGALCRRLRKDGPKPAPFDDVVGDGQINDVVLVDQSPVGRTPRSNPVTYIKAFDEIRNAFASTVDARTHNYTAGHFSFNVDGGRCTACEGDGQLSIDMQFLADVYMKCAQCDGKRYRREILDVRYRGKNIAEVLELTVREAFTLFRGQVKVQSRLKQLIDVGLDYIRLGQPANTLSSGESQRLKLAAHLSGAGRHRTLFILDEPTTGLHFADVVTLLDCFEALLSVGHSLIVVEHNLQLIKSADYIVDIGPGAGDAGGRIVAFGSPEEVAANPDSVTGKYLSPVLQASSRD